MDLSDINFYYAVENCIIVYVYDLLCLIRHRAFVYGTCLRCDQRRTCNYARSSSRPIPTF